MAKNNNTQIISTIISRLDKKIIDLETREHINVSMRIDEITPFLINIRDLAKNDESTRKFDLSETKTGSCSVLIQQMEKVSLPAQINSYMAMF